MITEKFIYKKWAGITALSASFTDFAYKKHCHEEYAFGVTLAGIQQYHLDGSREISYPHGVMLFNPEQVHDGMARDKTGLRYVMLYVEPAAFLELLERRDSVRFSTPIVYDHRLEQSIVSLAKAVLSASDESLCSELLLAFADHFRKVDFNPAARNDDVLTKKAKEMIHCSREDVLKLDDICQELCISKFKLIRRFKASTGLSPYQYFLNRKIALARRSLEENRDIYSTVADCGFVDLAHLNRHFKSIYGTTAFEYMNLT
ncbi:MAG: AraC family transcriptional regulator [Negativicutes bacterium]|nr:AraC family transcriptional regulator [Negativicutes bacterium]